MSHTKWITAVLAVLLLAGCSGDRVLWDSQGQYDKAGERKVWDRQGQMQAPKDRVIWENKEGEAVFK